MSAAPARCSPRCRSASCSSSLEAGIRCSLGARRRPLRAPGSAGRWDGVHFEVLHPAGGDYARDAEAERAVVRAARRARGGQQRAAHRRHRARRRKRRWSARSAARAAQRRADRAAPRQPDLVDRGVPRRGRSRELAVFQAGYRSRFGHPARRRRRRATASAASRIVATPRCGAWHWPHATVARAGRLRTRRRAPAHAAGIDDGRAGRWHRPEGL